MSFGKMNTFIDIITTELPQGLPAVKDAEGFVNHGDTVLASVRAYKEQRHGNEKWANMAAFSSANAMFRFRKISGLTVDTTMVITDADGRYRIISVEDVRGRGMYVEALAEKQEGTVR